jgi:hypothetical protein
MYDKNNVDVTLITIVKFVVDCKLRWDMDSCYTVDIIKNLRVVSYCRRSETYFGT